MTLTDEHHCAGGLLGCSRAHTTRQSFNEGQSSEKNRWIGIGTHSIPFARCVAYTHTDSFAYTRMCVRDKSIYLRTHIHACHSQRRSTPGRRARVRARCYPPLKKKTNSAPYHARRPFSRLIPAIPTTPHSRRPTIVPYRRLESVTAAATAAAALYGVREARREETRDRASNAVVAVFPVSGRLWPLT